MSLETIAIGVFIIACLVIGLIAGKDVKDLKGFSLSRRTFNSFALTATIVASFLGGGTIVGSAEKSFTTGIGYLVALMGFPLQMIFTAIFISPRMEKFNNSLSVGDIIKVPYGKSAQVVTGVLWMLFCTGIIIAQVSALGKTVSLFLDTDFTTSIIIGAGTVIIYCYFGGIRAVVNTDIIQFIVLGIALPMTFIFGVVYLGGIQETFNSVPPEFFNPIGYLSPLELIVIFFSFLLGDALIPPVVQRLLMAKDAKQSYNTMFTSGIIIFALCIVGGGLGIIAHGVNPDIESGQVIPFLFRTILPAGFTAIAIAGIVAVIMSTADSYLNSSAVIFVNDIVKPLAWKKLSEKSELQLAKNTTVVIGSIAIFFALYVENVLDVLLHTYKFWGPTLAVPIAGVILGKQLPNTRSFFMCCGAGALVVVIWELYRIEEACGISGLVPGILTNIIVYTVIYNTAKLRRKVF
jgi:solute:Na+ symporter, SSS family